MTPHESRTSQPGNDAFAIRTFTTTEVGRMCGVDASTVVRWIRGGHLKAFATPGRHRRIRADELFGFLREHNMPVPPGLMDHRPLRVLIVDDEPGVVEIVSRAMRQERPDLEIETAHDGFEACLKAGDFKPDLLMLDVVLPGMDGPRVCAAVRGQADLSHTCIVAMTGYPDDPRVAATLEAGADRCLAKPLAIDDLRALIREIAPLS